MTLEPSAPLFSRSPFGILAALLCLLSQLPALPVNPLRAAPPEISGGPYLVDRPGVNVQVVALWSRPGPYAVTIFDPDPTGWITVEIRVGGPLGGLKGGGIGIIQPSGSPSQRSLTFIAGTVPGASWIEIRAGDGTSSVTRYINFLIEPAPDPPAGEIFRVGTNGERYHFLVLATDPQQIAIARDILAGRLPQKIVIGDLVKGDGGFNVNPVDPAQRAWSWYLDPPSVQFADVTIELCDGRPCFVEAGLDVWVNSVGAFCPWNTFLREHVAREPTPEPRLSVEGSSATVLRWTAVGAAVSYDAIRGSLSALSAQPCSIALGTVVCLADDTSLTDTAGSPDYARPLPGRGFFYLVRYRATGGTAPYGTGVDAFFRDAGGGDCPAPTTSAATDTPRSYMHPPAPGP